MGFIIILYGSKYSESSWLRTCNNFLFNGCDTSIYNNLFMCFRASGPRPKMAKLSFFMTLDCWRWTPFWSAPSVTGVTAKSKNKLLSIFTLFFFYCNLALRKSWNLSSDILLHNAVLFAQERFFCLHPSLDAVLRVSLEKCKSPGCVFAFWAMPFWRK